MTPEPSSGVAFTSAGASSVTREAGAGQPVEAGAPRAIYWGLQPGSSAPDAGLAEQVLARLEVMALGSRIMTYVSTGEQDDFGTISRAPDLGWVLTLPFEAFAAMDETALLAWVERVWLLGDAIRFLILGQHLETDLAAVPSSERDLLVQRLEAALRLVKAHPARPPGVSVGVGFVTMVYTPTVLLAESDVIALSYSGLEPWGEIVEPGPAREELQGRVAKVGEYNLPVILQDLAYPSADGDDRQLQFFREINAWFSGPNSPNVRAVIVSSLNPPAAGDCEAWAEDWQVTSGADARCSVGMRGDDGEPKPALNEVIELLAEFAQL